MSASDILGIVICVAGFIGIVAWMLSRIPKA